MAFAVDNKPGLRSARITSQRSSVHTPCGVEDAPPSNSQRTEQSTSHSCLSRQLALTAKKSSRAKGSRVCSRQVYFGTGFKGVARHSKDCTVREAKIARQLNFGRIITVGHLPLHTLSLCLCDAAASATPRGSDYQHPVDAFRNYAM